MQSTVIEMVFRSQPHPGINRGTDNTWRLCVDWEDTQYMKNSTFWISQGIKCLFTQWVLTREFPDLHACPGSMILSSWLRYVSVMRAGTNDSDEGNASERPLYKYVPLFFMNVERAHQCVLVQPVFKRVFQFSVDF